MTAGQSFTTKQLRATVILAGTNAKFPGTNSNTLVLEDMRMFANVQAVARLATQMDLRIWGMRREDMDALTLAWANPPIVRDHIVILEANSGDAWGQVFRGTILEAQPDYEGAPDVAFRLQAITGYFVKVNPAPPSTYPGDVDITDIVVDLAEKMGFTPLISSDVNAILTTPYLSGTYYDQLQQACNAANVDFWVLGSDILVTRQNLPRVKQPALVLNPQSGLIGYPSYERAGLNVMCLYNQAILCGTPVDIQGSIVPNVNGRWYPYSTEHVLESRKPNGAWFSRLYCLRVIGEDSNAAVSQ